MDRTPQPHPTQKYNPRLIITQNNALRCWRWFAPEHQLRGAGEPAQLAAIVEQVKANYRVDAARVFVAGLSSGAAMAVILGATYPELFAAIGLHSGLEYKAATDMFSALKAQRSGGPDPHEQGLAAFRAIGTAMGAFKRKLRVIVFHGMEDTTVSPINADQVIAQWASSTHSTPSAVKVLYETVHHLHIRFRGWFYRHARHTSGFSELVTQSPLRSSSGSVASLAKPSRQLRHRQSL